MVERLVAELSASPKYTHVCPGVLVRVAGWAAARHPTPRAASRAARRKLHQVCSAFIGPAEFRRLRTLVDMIPGAAPADVVKEACRRILAVHASSRERLPFLDGLYDELLADAAPPTSVLDVACGLNPFALPWMGLPPAACYRAWDMDARLVSAANAFLERVGRPPGVACVDALGPLPPTDADLIFILKALPCFEQQEKGAALRLLQALPAPRVIVSFPALTLGGRQVGMRTHYAAFMHSVAAALPVRMREVHRPTETFYVLAR